VVFGPVPPLVDPSNAIVYAKFCVCALCASCVLHKCTEITEIWIFSKMSKFDRETNLTILVSFLSDILCACASFLSIYRPIRGDLANLIITLFLRDFWTIQIFLADGSPSGSTTFYTNTWSGRPLLEPTLVRFRDIIRDYQVDYPELQGGILESRHFLEQVSTMQGAELLMHPKYVYTSPPTVLLITITAFSSLNNLI